MKGGKARLINIASGPDERAKFPKLFKSCNNHLH